VDAIFKDKMEFCKRTISTLANSGGFSSDKAIQTLCDKVWKVESVAVPKPSINASVRFKSQSNLGTFASQEFNSKGSIEEDEDDDDI